MARADLTAADLAGAYLPYADLEAATLRGASLAGANLADAYAARADFTQADLDRADLGYATLRAASLAGARLMDAVLAEADLAEADLTGADLTGASLHGANLEDADLSGACLRDGGLTRANLRDARLDGADLTGVDLWAANRTGWSIRGVTCRQAFWGPPGGQAIAYGAGEFERRFAERPRLTLRHPGTLKAGDLTQLALILEQLRARHPACALRVRAVHEDGEGTVVTIAVADRAGRDATAFAAEVRALGEALHALQRRLGEDPGLRLALEAGHRALIRDLLPRLAPKPP